MNVTVDNLKLVEHLIDPVSQIEVAIVTTEDPREEVLLEVATVDYNQAENHHLLVPIEVSTEVQRMFQLEPTENKGHYVMQR